MAIKEKKANYVERKLDQEEAPLPLDPILYPLPAEDLRAREVLVQVTREVIKELKGIMPTSIEVVEVQNPDYSSQHFPRVRISFEVNTLDADQLSDIEELAVRMYGQDIPLLPTKKKKASVKKTAPLEEYPIMEAVRGKAKTKSTMVGYFLGKNQPVNRLSEGIMLTRTAPEKIAVSVKLEKDDEWLLREKLSDTSQNLSDAPFTIEIREKCMYMTPQGRIIEGPYQVNLIQSIVYLSMILSGQRIPDKKPGLISKIYNKLNVIGLGPDQDLPGLETPLEQVKRVLFYPAANPELMRALKTRPKSAMLVGQPGTGKTQLVKKFIRLASELNLICSVVSAEEFGRDLRYQPHERKIVPRINEVAEEMGSDPILIIEDFENIAHKDNPLSKELINLLFGAYPRRFHLITSTNHPEQVNPQLLQPDRLGERVFCSLPGLDARGFILREYIMNETSSEKIALFNRQEFHGDVSAQFPTDEALFDFLITSLASTTEGFNPRALRDIVTEANYNFVSRIVNSKREKQTGLNEADIEGTTYLHEDWINALHQVLEYYNPEERIEMDEELRKFCEGEPSKKSIGYNRAGETNGRKRFEPLAQFSNIFPNGKSSRVAE
jgi:hypothetical protein